MKNLISALAISVLITTPAFADQDHQHGKGQNMQGNMMMEMMSHEQMMAMHKHMQSMRETMDKVLEEKDSEKRQALMKEHMDQIAKGMQMMDMMQQEEGNDLMSMSNMMEMMNERMGMMNENMGMMQMMMGQMRKHEAEKQRDQMRMQKQ